MTYDQLTEEAQTKAMQWAGKTYEYPVEEVSDDMNEQIKEEGFLNPKVQFSLNYSQGDGLSFSADEYTKLNEVVERLLGPGKTKRAKLIADNLRISVTGNTGRYFYASYSDVEVDFDNYNNYANCACPNIEAFAEKVQEEVANIYMELCKKLKNQGYDTFYPEEKELEEWMIANEYSFNEEGHRD